MIKTILNSSLVLLLVLSASLAMANPVYDLGTTTSIELTPCNLPIQLVGIPLEPSETSEWVVIEGNIQFSGQGTQIAIILDLEAGTAAESKFKFGYVIKNAASEPLRRDTVTLQFNDTDGCVSIDIDGDPDMIECDSNSIAISAKANSEFTTGRNYKYVWSTSTEGVSFNNPDSAVTDFKITTPGLKTVRLDIYTLPFENWLGTSGFSLTSNCEAGYSLSGNVKAGGALWNNGMIYLYDLALNKTVDSVQFVTGSYLFSDVPLGTYTLYGVPYTDNTSTQLSTEFVPTYYVNKVSKSEANTFEVVANTFGVDLSLIDAVTASVKGSEAVSFSAYPNPFSEELTIETWPEETELIISNVQGDVIFTVTTDQLTTLNTSDWERGVYFIQASKQSGLCTLKVIK